MVSHLPFLPRVAAKAISLVTNVPTATIDLSKKRRPERNVCVSVWSRRPVFKAAPGGQTPFGESSPGPSFCSNEYLYCSIIYNQCSSPPSISASLSSLFLFRGPSFHSSGSSSLQQLILFPAAGLIKSTPALQPVFSTKRPACKVNAQLVSMWATAELGGQLITRRGCVYSLFST